MANKGDRTVDLVTDAEGLLVKAQSSKGNKAKKLVEEADALLGGPTGKAPDTRQLISEAEQLLQHKERPQSDSSSVATGVVVAILGLMLAGGAAAFFLFQ